MWRVSKILNCVHSFIQCVFTKHLLNTKHSVWYHADRDAHLQEAHSH
jgi:hypothetical protein